MAYPDDIAVLDTFAAYNSSNYIPGIHSAGGSHLAAAGGYAVLPGDGVVYSDVAWRPGGADAAFGPDIALALLDVVPGGGGGIWMNYRGGPSGVYDSSADGYQVDWFVAGTLGIYRVDNGGLTLIGSSMSVPMGAGDSMAVVLVGSLHEVWHKPAAGPWGLVGTRTEATYSGAGWVGLGIYDPSGVSGGAKIGAFAAETYTEPEPEPESSAGSEWLAALRRRRRSG